MNPLDPAAIAPPGPAIDAATLGRLHELDPGGRAGIVLRVLRTYDQALAGGLAALATSGERADAPEVRRLTHTLKSSSASVGALGFSALCGAAERLARDSWHAELPPLLAQLAVEGRRVQAALMILLPPLVDEDRPTR